MTHDHDSHNADDPGVSEDSRRSARFRARAGLWEFSTSDRLRGCGRVSTLKGGGVNVRHTPCLSGSAGYSGFASCGSVWACPVCSARILSERQTYLDAAFNAWSERGGTVAFLTLTMSHKKTDPLDDLWDSIQSAWGSVYNTPAYRGGGRSGIGERGRYGVGGWTRVVEVTHGDNGWHVHLHVVLYLEHRLSDNELEHWAGSIGARWRDGLAKSGHRAVDKVRYRNVDGFLVTENVGVDLRQTSPGETEEGSYHALTGYVTKATYTPDVKALRGLSMEAARSDLKSGRSGNLTPWQILDHASTGEADAIELWWEWEAASHKRRQFGWSKGFRELLGLARERTEQEIVDDETGGEDVLSLPVETVRALVKETSDNRGVQPVMPALVQALDHLDRYGEDGLKRWLNRKGLAWGPPIARDTDEDSVAAAGTDRSLARTRAAMPVDVDGKRRSLVAAHGLRLLRRDPA